MAGKNRDEKSELPPVIVLRPWGDTELTGCGCCPGDDGILHLYARKAGPMPEELAATKDFAVTKAVAGFVRLLIAGEGAPMLRLLGFNGFKEYFEFYGRC